MPKSSLAAEIAKRPPTKNAFASVPGSDYAQRIFVSAPLFADEAKEALIKLIEYGQKEAVQDAARGAPAEVVNLVDAVFKSLKATVESGEMDLAAALRGPNKDGFYTAVGAVHCKQGAQLEKAIKEAVNKAAPEQVRGFFKFDAQKIGDLTVNEIDLTSIAEEPAKKIFGEGQKAYFAFGKDALYAAYGPDAMKLLKEAMAAKPGPAPPLDSTADGKKMSDIMKKLIPANANGPRVGLGFAETMTSGLQVTLVGGDRLKVRVSFNLTMLLMGFGGFAVEASGGAAPAAVPAKD
jgi:hypothetical protein